jgi:hypothetical protein
LPEGSDYPLKQLPEGSDYPLKQLPEGSDYPLKQLPEGSGYILRHVKEGCLNSYALYIYTTYSIAHLDLMRHSTDLFATEAVTTLQELTKY